MAVGLPIIAPIHTSIREITLDGKACYAITELNDHFQVADYENIRHIPNVEETANQMIQAYMDAHNGILVDTGLYSEILSEYDWDKIAETWKVIFGELL
jgi:glycosyltransferase involved in cell wall biosynthesis